MVVAFLACKCASGVSLSAPNRHTSGHQFGASKHSTYIDANDAEMRWGGAQVVAPAEVRECYSEALALMPNCYFVNDYKRAHTDILDEVLIVKMFNSHLPEVNSIPPSFFPLILQPRPH